MDYDMVLKLFVKLIAQFVFEFLDGCGTVEACGNQKGDLDIGIALAEFTDHVGQNVSAGNRSCVIADDNDTVLFSFGQLIQPGAVNRILHCLTYDIKACPVTLELVHFTGQDGCIVRYLQVLCGLCIKKFDCLHRF